MNRSVQFLLLIFILSACGKTQPQEATSTESVVQQQSDSLVVQSHSAETTAMVYVTSEGNKYHTADCRYAEHAAKIKLSQAKADGKTACGICKPSSATGEKQLRCSAQTEEGKQCQRMTTDASGKCFQHQKKK